jgi:NAD(P)-dependent dehydrogenase (short-subunit alcohol dehydrogenase family)
MRELTGKVAVITGGGSGIGLAVAHELGAAGCRLSLADIDGDALQRASRSLGECGYDVITNTTDVGQLADVEALAEATLAELGAVHVVVNNAGVIAWNPIEALTLGEWRWVFEVNVWGVIHGVHVFLPIMEGQGTEGHFVNVSSVGGVLADTPSMSTYSATKAAVIGLSLTLASEMRAAGRPIGVSIVCPSATRDSAAHLAERNRPADLAPLSRRPEAQALLDMVSDVVADGQPVETVARRVVDAIRSNELWVFPHPEAAAMLEPRLDALRDVLRTAALQPLSE